MKQYDEDEAVDFIRKKISEKGVEAGKYTSDDILEVIDIIWDFYEDNGMLDLNLAEEGEDPEEKHIAEHVVKMVRKDRDCRIAPEDVPAIVAAELEYEATLDEF